MGPLDAPFMGPGQGPTRGLLGEAGQYGLGTSKLADIALGGKKGFDKGIGPLKAVAWGSAIVGGIQAGKYKDAMEAANAAEDAARGEGVIDEEWIINARREAEEYWNAWSSEVTYEPYTGAEGGRVGYNTGQLVRPGPGRPGYGGGARGQAAQELAMEIAETQYGQDFYDLDDDLQHKIYTLALQQIDEQGLAQGGRVGYQLGVGPVGGIGAMAPQLPMQQSMMQQPMQQPMQQQMQNPPPREGGLGRLPIEADMRYTGGFMPYGETEKADDVPARLSKNEFVFTADAVKAAGGGSVNKGAKKLYDTMKQLEAMS